MFFIRLQSLVPHFIRNIFVRKAAGRDVPQYMAAYVVATWLSKMPAFSPRSNAEHARINNDRKLPKEVSEWKSKLLQKEEDLTQYTSRWVLRIILAFLYAAEVFGDIQLLIMVNIDGVRRLIMSLAFAFFIFFITWYCTSAKKRTTWWKWGIAGYAAIAIAIAIIQIHGTPSTDEATFLSNIAGGVIMVCATVGPALAAHFIIELCFPHSAAGAKSSSTGRTSLVPSEQSDVLTHSLHASSDKRRSGWTRQNRWSVCTRARSRATAATCRLMYAHGSASLNPTTRVATSPTLITSLSTTVHPTI